MSEFKYIERESYYETINMLHQEQAHQLKRIADALEWQRPFEWQGRFWNRADIAWISPVMKNPIMLRIKAKGEGQHKFIFPTKEKAEAARAEFLKLWEGSNGN